MKIVSSLVFAAALISTWCMTRMHGAQSQSVHVGVQNDLKNIIAEYVEKNLPSSKDLRFDKFWTESLKKNKIKATFVYSFEDTASEETGSARVEISGSAILNKVDENAETVTYSLDELQIKDNKIEFAEPIQITAEAPGKAAIDEPKTETK
jgi:hypothetical protein